MSVDTVRALSERHGADPTPVWPDVRTVATLHPPPGSAAARLKVPSRPEHDGLDALEVNTRIVAVADEAERTIHFRIGPQRPCRATRVAQDLLAEVDASSRLAGFWLLNVPPFPSTPTSQ